MSARARLKNLLWRRGWVVARTSHPGARYLSLTPRAPLEDVLLRIFPTLENLSFIQVGAGDGVLADPIVHLIDRFYWTGLMIEPLPDRFERLEQRHGGKNRLTLLRAAVDVHRGTRHMYRIRPEREDLPDWVAGLPSLSPERLRQATAELGLGDDAVVAVPVQTVDWDEVLRLFGGRHCDLLVIDAEGYDICLLRESAARGLRPTVIHFEHACADRREQLSVYGELMDAGYELATWGGDTVAYLRR